MSELQNTHVILGRCFCKYHHGIDICLQEYGDRVSFKFTLNYMYLYGPLLFCVPELSFEMNIYILMFLLLGMFFAGCFFPYAEHDK